jgi:hypothetical protein
MGELLVTTESFGTREDSDFSLRDAARFVPKHLSRYLSQENYPALALKTKKDD